MRDEPQAVLDTASRLGQMSPPILGGYARLSVDVITAILSAASRGAAETGRAMSMRGALDAVGEVGGSVRKRRTRQMGGRVRVRCDPVGVGWRRCVHVDAPSLCRFFVRNYQAFHCPVGFSMCPGSCSADLTFRKPYSFWVRAVAE